MQPRSRNALWRKLCAAICLAAFGLWLFGCRAARPPRPSPLKEAAKLIDAGRFQRARAKLDTLLAGQQDPVARAETLLLRSSLAIATGEYNDAVARLESVGSPPENLRTSFLLLLAEALALSGRVDRAEKAVTELLAGKITVQQRLRAQLILARIMLKKGKLPDAFKLAKAVVDSKEPELRARANFLCGLALARANRWEEAFRGLSAGARNLGPGFRRFEAATLAARAAEKVGKFYDALVFYQTAAGELGRIVVGPEKRPLLTSAVERLVLQKLTVDELEEVATTFGRGWPADIATIALARALIRQGLHTRARSVLEPFKQRFPNSPYSFQAAQLLKVIETRAVADTSKLGLIAPLTGRLGFFGQQVRTGVREALRDFWEASQASIALVVRDSQGDPNLAEEALQDLAENENVIAVVGPILSKSVAEVSAMADEYGIVVFSPSACGSGILSRSRFVIRNCIPLWTQACAIASFAVKRLHLLRIAVLMPERRFGTVLADAFVRSATTAGAEIIYVRSYAPETTDFRDQLVDLCPLEPEAIFIADYASKVALIAPQVLFHNIHDAVLLGWEGWYSAEALAPVLDQMEGSFFVSGWWLGSDRAAANRLCSDVLSESGVECSALMAQSYDATSMICKALWRGATYRYDVRDAILSMRFDGVLGRYGFTASGQATRPLCVLTICGGRLLKVCDAAVQRATPG